MSFYKNLILKTKLLMCISVIMMKLYFNLSFFNIVVMYYNQMVKLNIFSYSIKLFKYLWKQIIWKINPSFCIIRNCRRYLVFEKLLIWLFAIGMRWLFAVIKYSFFWKCGPAIEIFCNLCLWLILKMVIEWIHFNSDPEFNLSLIKLNELNLQCLAAMFYEVEFLQCFLSK